MNERTLPPRGFGLFASLRFRDFRLLWVGLLISNLGTWMQFTAMGYFVAKLASTPAAAALDLGILGACRAVPVLLCSPIAGVVADTLPRRATLFLANLAMALVALALAVLVQFGMLNLWWLVWLSVINSAAASFDSPARQSWVPLLVEPPYVGNAIGLNSIAFNAPAVIGPALAGVLIAGAGIAWSFYVNAVATLAVVVAVVLMLPAAPSIRRRDSLFRSMREGLSFLAGHGLLRYIMLAFVVTAVLVRPYSTLLPAYIVNTLHGNAAALGVAVAAIGTGGFGGAIITAIVGQRERRGTLWLASGLALSLGVALLGAVHSWIFSLPVLFAIGVATITFLGMSNILIQTLSPSDVRGRAISVYSMVALGVVPGGALAVGAFSASVGLLAGFAVAGTVCAALMLWLWIAVPILRTV
ncbi:MAG: MFS transporter [Vulcanimicrobiaceae bacterium]